MSLKPEYFYIYSTEPNKYISFVSGFNNIHIDVLIKNLNHFKNMLLDGIDGELKYIQYVDEEMFIVVFENILNDDICKIKKTYQLNFSKKNFLSLSSNVIDTSKLINYLDNETIIYSKILISQTNSLNDIPITKIQELLDVKNNIKNVQYGLTYRNGYRLVLRTISYIILGDTQINKSLQPNNNGKIGKKLDNLKILIFNINNWINQEKDNFKQFSIAINSNIFPYLNVNFENSNDLIDEIDEEEKDEYNENIQYIQTMSQFLIDTTFKGPDIFNSVNSDISMKMILNDNIELNKTIIENWVKAITKQLMVDRIELNLQNVNNLVELTGEIEVVTEDIFENILNKRR